MVTMQPSRSPTAFLTRPTASLTGKAITGSVLGLCTTIFLLDNVIEWHAVRGSSMHPSLSPDYETHRTMDRLLFWKFGAARNIRRGQIISFWAPHDPEKRVVKRVVGIPGDVVFPKQRYPWDRVKVPSGHVWVEGDNELQSKDSNDYGPVGSLAYYKSNGCLTLIVCRSP
jgi:mitochondrial inner membrane protease subunit 2